MRILSPTTLGPIEPTATGPSVWRGAVDLFRTMWLARDTCGACFGQMEIVAFDPPRGSLPSTFRCRARLEPIVYATWNECRLAGRHGGYQVDPTAVEQERLFELEVPA